MSPIINKTSEIVIALGSNLPTRAGSSKNTLKAALSDLASTELTLRKKSRFFATPAFPAGIGPDYVNSVALFETPLTAADVLSILHTIENRFGRERQARWGNRTLDLDLIAYGQDVVPDRAIWDQWASLDPQLQREAVPDQLVLPHPRVQERAFVLVPMADVAPDWRHPITGHSVTVMLAALPADQIAEIRPLGDE